MRSIFRAIIFWILLFLVACANSDPSSPIPANITPQPIPLDALVIKNGTVIDGTGAPPLRDGVIVIRQDKIVAVGRAAEFVIAPQTRIIDAQGGTIMPGIINSHVHEAASGLIRQYYFLQRGVTTACDVGGAISVMADFAVDSGYGLTARGFRTGPIINVPLGYPGYDDLLYPVSTPDQARQAVTDLIVNHGADMIKTALDPWNSKLPWFAPPPGDPIPNPDLPLLQAIVDQAHRYRKPVRMHLGTEILLDLALDAGVDSIEHVPLPTLDNIDFQSPPPGKIAKLSEHFQAQLQRMVKQRVMMVPTVDHIITWCEGFAQTPEQKNRCGQYALAPVQYFHDSGGTIGLGDDATSFAHTLMPIGEMKRLAQAGLSSMEIIQAGTKYAAQICGHGDELGTLEPGKLADVIVVNGDPLANIAVMDQVSVVVIGGQVAVPCDPKVSKFC